MAFYFLTGDEKLSAWLFLAILFVPCYQILEDSNPLRVEANAALVVVTTAVDCVLNLYYVKGMHVMSFFHSKSLLNYPIGLWILSLQILKRFLISLLFSLYPILTWKLEGIKIKQ